MGDGDLQLGREAHCTVWGEEVNSEFIYFFFFLFFPIEMCAMCAML